MNLACPDQETASFVTRRKVLLVDDHPVVREALSSRINAEEDLVVCAEARSPAEALRALARFEPDVLVVDLALSEGHGLELIKEIRARQCLVPILVFSMFDESIYGLRVLQAGAQGYVMKLEPSDRLLEAIRTILKGEYAMSSQAAHRVLKGFLSRSSGAPGLPLDKLGDRELEVLQLIGKGLGTREVAAQLGRSVKTVETYRARIKKKLQLSNATALIREAIRYFDSQG